MSQPAREYLSARVSGDKLEAVLTVLLSAELSLPDHSQRQAMLLSGRLTNLNEQIRNGTLAPDEAARERNRIRKSLLGLVADLAADLMLPPAMAVEERRLRYRWLASLAAYLLIAGSLLFFLFQPQTNLRVEGELTMDRFSFIHQQGEYELEGIEFSQVRITDFRQLEAEADSLELQTDIRVDLEPSYQVPEGSLRLRAIPDIPGLGVNLLTSTRLEALDIQSGTMLTLERLPDERGSLRILVEQMDSLSCTVSYMEQAHLQTEEVLVEGIPALGELSGLASWRLFGETTRRSSIVFHSLPALFGLELYPQDSLVIAGKSLMISDPTFLRKEGDVVRPTILGARLVLQEHDHSPLQTIQIQEGEGLALTCDQPIAIRQVSLVQDGIRIAFEGEMDKIESGAYLDVRNPLRIEWLWHNHRLLLIALGLLGFGIIFFLPGPVRESILRFVKHMRSAQG
ncbi:MAG: hypothetical protein AAF587_21500 [Bacteroidota bacterium]